MAERSTPGFGVGESQVGVGDVTLSGLSEHANNNPATAGVQFSEITKGGASKAINQCVIAGQDKHVSELKWTFKATNCWAHAVVQIQCFD